MRGITQLENVVVTGNVQGISHSVDGIDILPNSVGTKRLTVTEALTVQGAANFSGINTNTLEAEGALTANTVTGVEGAFTTLTVSGEAAVNGDLAVEGGTLLKGALGVAGGVTMDSTLTVAGNTVFGGSTGTTTVHNLNITGDVLGWSPDLTGQSVTVTSMSADSVNTTNANANSATINNLSVSNATVQKIGFNTDELTATVDVTSGVWSPDGDSQVYIMHLDKNIALDAWAGITAAGTEDDPKPNAFSAIIYVIQDATGGHALTFSSNYAVVSRTQAIGGTANQVSILQLTYPGFGDIVDVIIAQRNV